MKEIVIISQNLIEYNGNIEESNGKVYNGLISNSMNEIKLKGTIKLFNNKRINILSLSTYPVNIGNNQYYFEFSLPGNLPPSLHNKNCEIQYQIKTEYKGVAITKGIEIQRNILVSNLILWENISVDNSWNNLINYNIYSEFKAFGKMDDIDLDLKLTMLEKGYYIQSVSCVLKQSIKLTHFNDTSLLKKLIKRTISIKNNIKEFKQPLFNNNSKNYNETLSNDRYDEPLSNEKVDLEEKSIHFKINNNDNRVNNMHFINEEEDILIDHYLGLLITIINKDFVPYQLMIKVPIVILNSDYRFTEILNNDLPSYSL